MERSCVATALLLMALVSGGCGSDVKLIQRVWAVEADGTVNTFGGECGPVNDYGESQGGGFDLGSDGRHFSSTAKGSRDGVTMTIYFKEERVYRRTFDEAFCESEEVEDFTYTTPDGTTFHFEFWGSDTCDVSFTDIPNSDAPTIDTAVRESDAGVSSDTGL